MYHQADRYLAFFISLWRGRCYSSSFPHLFPLACGVDVSYETSPSGSVLSVLPGQFSLGQVVPDAIQPPPLWSSSPSFPRHLHRHHSSSCLRIHLLFSIRAHTTFNLLSCTFLDISPTFVVPLILSFLILSSLVTPLIHLNILISAASNFFSSLLMISHNITYYMLCIIFFYNTAVGDSHTSEC